MEIWPLPIRKIGIWICPYGYVRPGVNPGLRPGGRPGVRPVRPPKPYYDEEKQEE